MSSHARAMQAPCTRHASATHLCRPLLQALNLIRPIRPHSFANPGFSKITGYSWPETLGKNCRFLQVSSVSIRPSASASDEHDLCKALARG
jgi:hypothetical protein